MEYSPMNIALQADRVSYPKRESALKKIFAADYGLLLQFLLIIPLVGASVVFHLNIIQWVLVLAVTLLFLICGVFRTASLLQIKRDPSLSAFQISRIKCMGNAIITVTAGLSLFTYMMVFIPKILPLI
jgi:hypothetical protein